MKKVDSVERAKHAAVAINNVKNNVRDFTKDELILKLRAVGCPYYCEMFKVLRDHNFITKVKYGVWRFYSKEPIYYGEIQKDLDDISAKYMGYYRTYSKKQETHSKVVPELVEAAISTLKEKGFKTVVITSKSEVQSAIELLKGYGYKVYEPRTEFVEV